jgi:hypothetical protein
MIAPPPSPPWMRTNKIEISRRIIITRSKKLGTTVTPWGLVCCLRQQLIWRCKQVTNYSAYRIDSLFQKIICKSTISTNQNFALRRKRVFRFLMCCCFLLKRDCSQSTVIFSAYILCTAIYFSMYVETGDCLAWDFQSSLHSYSLDIVQQIKLNK